MLWNNVLFVPLGALLEMLFGKKSFLLSVLIGAAVSAGIEFIQLVWKIGLFEFDDIMYNTLGCLIGVLLVMEVKRFTER